MKQQGRIKILFGEPSKTHGFVTTGDEDFFFHQDDLRDGVRCDDLAVNDLLTFEARTTLRGPRAVNLHLVQ